MKYLVCEVEHYGLTEKYGSSAFKISHLVNSIVLNQNGWTRQHEAHHYSYYFPSYQDADLIKSNDNLRIFLTLLIRSLALKLYKVRSPLHWLN